MKALVYLGPAKKALEERQKPEITAPTDAIVKITKTTICGTDLHILKGDVPSCQPGRILGHEGVLTVDQFASGSMGPKVEAATMFAAATGRPAAIGRLEDAVAILRGDAGTRIEAGRSEIEFR